MTDPATFNSFHGGVTDYYLNGPVEKCRTADNLVILPYGKSLAKLRSRYGSELYDVDYPQIPPGSQRIGTLKYFSNSLLVHSSRKVYYLATGWQELIGPMGISQTFGNPIFPSTVTVNNVASFAEWNNHLFVTTDGYTKPHKIYRDGSSNLQLRTAGLPYLSNSFVITGGTGALTNNYIYAIQLEYTYTVGTVVFKDYGPPTYKQFTSTYDTTRTLGTIAYLVNNNTGNVDDNYDTNTIKVAIYRTINNGVELFKVGEVANGTTTFNDTVSDATLITNEALYTTGGVSDNAPPPLCKLIHIVEGVGYYACIKEGSEILNNRVRQSIAGDIDSCPEDYYADVDQNIIGISSAAGVVVLLCENSVWRIDGRYDELGREGMIPTRVSDTASCVSSGSVVQTFEGVFWAGKDAFYFSNGYSVTKLNKDQDISYAAFVSTDERKRRITGVYDGTNRRIYWTLQSTDKTECDRVAVLHLDFGLNENAAFTYWVDDGGDNFSPTALEVQGEYLHRADRRGYIFTHKKNLYSDYHVDVAASTDDWYKVPIKYNFESCATNFGTDFERKYVTWINFQAKNDTKLALQITSNNDDGRKEDDLAIINYKSNVSWGTNPEIWGDPQIKWNSQGYIEEMRRFPKGSLRCSYKSIIFKNAYVNIYNSDLLGTVNVNPTTKTATLTSPTLVWPNEIEGYYVCFENNYDREFKILSKSTDTLVFEDISNFSVLLTGAKWYIRGYPKDQILNLISYTLHYSVFGHTQDKFQSSESNNIGG